MSEEIKNEEEEINIDEKLNNLLEGPLVRTEEDKTFIKNIGESLKKGEFPIETVSNKVKESLSKLEDLKKEHPEFESFVSHYKNIINENMLKMTDLLKTQNFKK
jgi:F0F1-type ATP synthase delta subunit